MIHRWAIAAALVLSGCAADVRQPVAIDRAPLRATTTSTTAPPTTTTAAPTTSTTVPAAPSDPGTLATTITGSEWTIRDPATAPEALAEAAFELQVAYRALARHPEWDAAAFAAIPAWLHSAVTHNLTARRQFRSMHRTLSDTLPAWRIVEPAPADELLAHYHEAEASFGVPWNVLAAINLVETGMGRIRGTSIAGAQGPMQFIPDTWAAFGEGDINDPRDAILAAARYLNHNGAHAGRLVEAIYRYNHSDHYVQGVLEYAAVMAEDPRTYYGFHAWQVVYLSTAGDIWLPVGYENAERVPVAAHLAAHPTHRLSPETG
jgi:membrane-bound lytic murein transglycosylase B